MHGTKTNIMWCTAVLQRLASQKGSPRTRAAGSATAQTGATSSSACWHQSRGRLQVGCRASPRTEMVHGAYTWNASHSCVVQESQIPLHSNEVSRNTFAVSDQYSCPASCGIQQGMTAMV